MVSITDVYKRVLIVLNKENRGYITREEFNSIAQQVQLEIFESYFAKQSLSLQGTNDTDYSDPMGNIEEKITFFDNVSGNISKTGNLFNYPNNFYRLSTVLVNGRISDEVSHNNLPYINLSPLTAPTETQSVYTRHEGGLRVYPDAVDSVQMVYLRRPTNPSFTGTVVGQQVLAGSNDIDFELHPSEEHEIVNRMLGYLGVVTRDADVSAFGGQQAQNATATEQ